MKMNKNFWVFGSFFYLYFFIWAACFQFLSIWLINAAGLNSTETGLIFSAISVAAICFQPFFGILTDKLGMKKHLIWILIFLLIFIAPFFLYVFAPLLQTNIILASLIGGVYLGAIFNGGVGAIEAFIERVSHISGFEYGRVRMFGCLGAATSMFISGQLFKTDPNLIFWICTLSAVLLAIVFYFSKIDLSQSKTVQLQKKGTN
ncbi:oligosaccharide MFS transporter [Bacillus sp. 03113]|uniref:oligosaccharide MFS transporter n=1 Tax=Bacillus sp. 03113 TaxID=2578211 RepID=UPI001C659063|nr:oligosaccharide MFS transporter [Bacillus sp. 03113]